MSAHLATLASTASRIARLAPRERGTENQMTLFMSISVGALAFMTLLPSPGTAFAAPTDDRVPVLADEAHTGGIVPVVASETDRLCAGQVWGAESLDCILAITRDSGMTRSIRLADAGHRI